VRVLMLVLVLVLMLVLVLAPVRVRVLEAAQPRLHPAWRSQVSSSLRISSATHLNSLPLRDERGAGSGAPHARTLQVLQRDERGADALQLILLRVAEGERERDGRVVDGAAGFDVGVEGGDEDVAGGRARAWDLDGLAVRPGYAIAVSRSFWECVVSMPFFLLREMLTDLWD
jgi:hypothetical protein